MKHSMKMKLVPVPLLGLFLNGCASYSSQLADCSG